MGDSSERSYSYGTSWGRILAVIVMFGGGSAVLAHLAGTNVGRISFDGLFAMTVPQATAFLWSGAAFCLVFAILGLFMAVRRLVVTPRITISPSGITLPISGGPREGTFIPFEKIIHKEWREAGSARFIELQHDHGRFTILGSCLPLPEYLEEIWLQIPQVAYRTRLAA